MILVESSFGTVSRTYWLSGNIGTSVSKFGLLPTFSGGTELIDVTDTSAYCALNVFACIFALPQMISPVRIKYFLMIGGATKMSFWLG